MLTIDKLTKKYASSIVLENVSLTAEEGTCYAIIGKNGAGKTTLLNLIYGLLKADSGKITCLGKNSIELSIEKGEIGYAGGNEFLIEEFTGFEFLRFISFVHNISSTVSDTNIKDLFTYFFDNESDINKPISSYSYGMKLKMSICASILPSPFLLLLDEPFSGLDPFSSNKLIDFLKTYMTSRTIILSSHDLSLISRIATHIVILDTHNFIYNDSLSNFTDNGFKTLDQSLFELIKPTDTLKTSPLDFILKK